ncbi:multicopper oxidase [Amycolatopsis echigonensis]|uniref:Multicopper oxidase n=2 Tax=Pseudonocardiaceae TaxID=2070 RepID=A0A2N3WJI3_9PSEU|nr:MULTISPECIES: multicopper oxidase domain-containing protein [Pseudonocardiaceae]AEA23517.1 multicopper oxidase type 3 [Pseudonocardia dioxanivorans CB1190]PKV94031.1 multicopper oxidase [Amycolatopsis niigatensis]
MDRRAFLTRLTAAALGGVLLPRSAMAPAADADGDRLRDLPEVRSAGGLLDYRLDMAATQVHVRDRVLTLDTYNGGLPGPILRVRPGDRMRLLLRNRMRPMGIPLNKLPPLCAAHPGDTAGTTGHPHGTLDCVPSAAGNMLRGHTLPQTMIATNIHTHGLQVSPEGVADNVFVRVDPLGSHQYSYDIPADHPAGMHWYHPHFHGSTSHQGWAGLSGPIIVEGDIDQVPEIAEMRERVLVANELWIGDDNGEVPTTLVIPTGGPVPFNGIPAIPSSMYFTINGQLLPEITIRPGETQRWRFLNASPHRALWLHIDEHDLHQIGQDGIPFATPRRRPNLMLTSGNRAEFIVHGGQPGRYRVYAQRYDQGHPGGPVPTSSSPPSSSPARQLLVESRTSWSSRRGCRTCRWPAAAHSLSPATSPGGTASGFDSSSTARNTTWTASTKKSKPARSRNGRSSTRTSSSTPSTSTSTPSKSLTCKGSRPATPPGTRTPRCGGTYSGYLRAAGSRCAPTSGRTRSARPSTTATSFPTRTTA